MDLISVILYIKDPLQRQTTEHTRSDQEKQLSLLDMKKRKLSRHYFFATNLRKKVIE